jgi:hypothetical protein
MVSCCLLGSRVGLGKGTSVLKVILYGETRSGMLTHSREAGFTRLWEVPGTISATLTAVGVDKTSTKGSFQWGFMVEHFISLPKLYPLVYKGAWELSG